MLPKVDNIYLVFKANLRHKGFNVISEQYFIEHDQYEPLKLRFLVTPTYFLVLNSKKVKNPEKKFQTGGKPAMFVIFFFGCQIEFHFPNELNFPRISIKKSL